MSHESVVYDGKMWVLGGSAATYWSDVWSSSDGVTWTEVAIAAGWPVRTLHSSAVHDGKIWVLGGSDQSSECFNDVWSSSDGVTWTKVDSAAPWSGRDNHTSVVHDDKIWVMGGSDTSHLLNDVWYLSVDASPVADAGPDQTIECESPSGTIVQLDGSGSSDPDSTPGTNDDIVSFEWFVDRDVLATGQHPSILLLLGTHVVTLRVTDSMGATDEDTVQITIADTTPPEITLAVTPNTLWPPNHKMVQGYPSVNVSDGGDPYPTVALKTITADEGELTNTYDVLYDNWIGDGNTANDIQVDADGRILLRAERSGKGDGRTYTITYEVKDASGNMAQASATVVVPHNV